MSHQIKKCNIGVNSFVCQFYLALSLSLSLHHSFSLLFILLERIQLILTFFSILGVLSNILSSARIQSHHHGVPLAIVVVNIGYCLCCCCSASVLRGSFLSFLFCITNTLYHIIAAFECISEFFTSFSCSLQIRSSCCLSHGIIPILSFLIFVQIIYIGNCPYSQSQSILF